MRPSIILALSIGTVAALHEPAGATGVAIPDYAIYSLQGDAQIVTNPVPSATANSYDANGYYTSTAQFIYYYEVIGPSTGRVPVNISYKLSGDQSGPYGYYNFLDSEIDYAGKYDGSYGYNGYVALQCNSNGGCFGLGIGDGVSSGHPDLIGNPSLTIVGNISLSVQAGQTNQLYLSAIEYGNNAGAASGGHSLVDPIITIDPNFLAANPGYSLIESANIGNSAAPEPATWGLMMLSVGGMGTALRSRRRKAVA